MNATTQQAIDFLTGKGVDGNGRVVAEYFNFDAAYFEQCHNWVQWAFPTRTPSNFNPSAPVIDDEFEFDMSNRDHLMARHNSAKLVAKYLSAMGFEVYQLLSSISPVYRIEQPKGDLSFVWEQPNDHNMLRFTRIIESLRIFHSDALAKEVYTALLKRVESNYSRYSPRSVAFWSLAYTQ